MILPRQHVVDILRISGLNHLAEEACRELPDPVEFDRAAAFLARYGIGEDELRSARGGSP
jgi:hypothetical protein